MPIEYEAKILAIHPDAMQRLILDKGGQTFGERFMPRYVYDITPGGQPTWIRLRNTGDETMLTIKQAHQPHHRRRNKSRSTTGRRSPRTWRWRNAAALRRCAALDAGSWR